MIRLLTGFLLLLAAPPLRAQFRHEFTEVHMGVAVRLVVYAPDSAQPRRAARAAFDRIAALEEIFSDYRPTSEVRRLEEHPGVWTRASPELLEVLRTALLVAALTNGAYDPTAGPLTTLWRQARREGALPPTAELDAARLLVNWRHLHVSGIDSAARLDRAGMRLDLGGIAKGYNLGQALAVLRAQGLPQALVQAGGDIVLGDPPPDQRGWDIAIAGGDPGLSSNLAVATSGTSEQYFEIDGVRYAHILDPRSGLGLATRHLVTVIGPNPAVADALATALVILGPGAREGLLAAFPGYRAVVVVPHLPEVTAPASPPQFRPRP
jgi:thiamine biosynthesis lipoprotein